MQNEETSKIAKEMYERGKSIREIARELNLSYSRVRKILKDSGVQFRGKLSRDIEEKIIDLAKRGYSANKISKETKINSNTVLRVLKKNNLAKTKRKLAPEKIEEIKNLYKNGVSIYKIAKNFNISTNLVVYHLKKSNVYKPTHESYSTSQ